MKIRPLFFFILLVSILSCKKSDPNFDYITLKDYKYTRADILNGATVDVVSFSGGRDCSKDSVIFYQFLAIVRATKDTVRVLTPCQTYDERNSVSVMYFQSIEDASPAGINKILGNSGKDEIAEDGFYVVVNKNHPLEKRDYKTVIGFMGVYNENQPEPPVQ